MNNPDYIRLGNKYPFYVRKADIISVEIGDNGDGWSDVTYMCSPGSHRTTDTDESTDSIAIKLGWHINFVSCLPPA
jgi:hypothetical protein